MEWSNGDRDAYDQLFPLVYDQLRELANHQLRRERNNRTINSTALVHELYIKMVDQSVTDWSDRKHFFFIAAKCMREILIDHARKKMCQKRGGNPIAMTLQENMLSNGDSAEILVAIDDLTDKLSSFNERLGKVVELRFFAGMTVREIAEIMQISESTVDRDWLKARGWIYRELMRDHKIPQD